MSPHPAQARPHAKARSAALEKISPLAPTEDQIRARAHQIYLERGHRPGLAEDDWYQAELELRSRIALLGHV